ncbi:MAG: sodium-dependent transporter [Alphaproteobacteria bacterium]|nr:MAG: sodium-dependent transporter [Alphaproteobacteria bacterium]
MTQTQGPAGPAAQTTAAGANTAGSSATRWSSHLGFVLTAAGAAVGLGNIWRFPYIAGENGGGAFVLVYLAAVVAIGFPVMVAELLMGRRGRGDAETAVRHLRAETGAGPFWQTIGVLSLLLPFVGIGYYSVVAGWVLDYLWLFLSGQGFLDPTAGGGGDYAARFAELQGSPWRLLFFHALFMGGVIAIVAQGVRQGLERAAKIMMPALFVMLLGLVFYAALKGDFGRGVAFLLAPDFAKLSWHGVLLAVGQAFFSLAIGIGALMTFGAYLSEHDSLPRSAAQICATDTMVALLAGLAIFPIVFSLGIDPAEGPGLIFVTLPAAFAQIPGGAVLGTIFFLLVFFAAFTTGIATLEPVVAWATGRGWARPAATLVIGLAAWIIGAAAALSFNVWQDVRPLGLVPGFEDRGIFDTLDYSIASLLLPVNGMLIALFVGWMVPRAIQRSETGWSEALLGVWRFFLRVLAPLAILAILLAG